MILDEGTVFAVSQEEAYYFGNDRREALPSTSRGM